MKAVRLLKKNSMRFINKSFSPKRFFGLSTHYLYSMKRNPARFIEILLWPSIEIVLFSMLTLWLQKSTTSTERVALSIISGVIFWNYFARIIQESVSQFTDDAISKNIQNFLITPVSLFEFVLSLMFVSLVKLLGSLVLLSLILLFFFPSFFSVIGIPGLLWATTLVLYGCVVSLLCISFLFIYGERLSFVGWFLSMIIEIFSCIFYERRILPGPLQAVSFLNPASYVFESIRIYLKQGFFDPKQLFFANTLTLILFAVCYGIFLYAYSVARNKGTLTKM